MFVSISFGSTVFRSHLWMPSGRCRASRTPQDVSHVCSSWEQVAPFKASELWLFEDQLGTWKLALLETIAFVLACVDVFRYGPTNRFICFCRMLVVVLVYLLHAPRLVAWLLRIKVGGG